MAHRHDLSRRSKKARVVRKQSIEEIMHRTYEKLGFQRFSIKFQIYDAQRQQYVALPGKAITVNIDTPVEMEKIIGEITELLQKRAAEREPVEKKAGNGGGK